MDHVRYSSGRSAYDTPPSAHGRALRPPSVRYPNRTGQCSNCQLETTKLDWMTPIAPSWRTDVACPHLIGPIDLHSAQQVWVDAMPWSRLRQPRFSVDRLQPDLPHQSTHPFRIDGVSLFVEPPVHLPDSVKRRPRVLLVDQAHQ